MTRPSSAIIGQGSSYFNTAGVYLVLQIGLLVLAGGSLAAGPVYWDWPAGRAFTELEREGIALDLQGFLVRGLDSREVGPGGPEVFWNLAADGKGGMYLGSGHGGDLYHMDSGGDRFLLAQLEGPEIFSILPLDDGTVLAGCGPDGQLFKVDQDGQSTLVGQVEGGYIWAMTRRPSNGEIWLAAGSPASVYRLDNNGELEAVQTLAAQNCLALTFLPDGRLLLGTQGPGLVYRLDPDDLENIEVLFQAPQDEVRQFITGPAGQLFFMALNSDDQETGLESGHTNGKNGGASTSLMSLFDLGKEPAVDKSALFKIDADGGVSPWWASDLDLMIVAWSQAGGWLGGGSLAVKSEFSVLHQLTAPAGHHPVARWEGGDILDILVQPGQDEGDRIWVAQAHPGTVREVGLLADGQPLAMSSPLDGGQRLDWGRLRWQGSVPGGKPRWSVRGGNRSIPDESWTDWSGSWTGNDHPIDLEPCRFLQWRVEFPRCEAGDEDGPLITGVSVSAWQKNLRPVVRDLVLEKVSDISLGGMMNGGDNVTQTFRSGLKAEFSRNSQHDRRAEGSRAAETRPVRIFTWQGQDPNGDRLVYRLEYLKHGEQAWREIIGQTEESIGSWDTSEVPDGHYQVRITASDEKDNPAGHALEISTQTGPILVDNSAPIIKGFALKHVADGFQVDLTAADASNSLAGAQVQLPDGTWQRLDPVDLICDSQKEKFSAHIVWPTAGISVGQTRWQVRVEVRDMAGNLAVAQGDLAAER